MNCATAGLRSMLTRGESMGVYDEKFLRESRDSGLRG